MTNSRALAGLLSALVLLGGGCGDNFIESPQSPAPLALEHVDVISGLAGSPAGLARVHARIPAPFELSVPDLSQLVGMDCTVEFRALDGAPFEGGTSAAIEVAARIERNGAVLGETPAATICGPSSVTAAAKLTLPSGLAIHSENAVIEFLAPTVVVGSVSPAGPFDLATAPTRFTLEGSGLGITNGTREFTASWRSSDPIFEGGISTETTTSGLIDSATAASIDFPLVSFCDGSAATGSLERIDFEDGTCILGIDRAFSWRNPAATDLSSRLLGSWSEEQVEFVGLALGPVGSEVAVTWAGVQEVGSTLPRDIFLDLSDQLQTRITTYGQVTGIGRFSVKAPLVIVPPGESRAHAVVDEIVLTRTPGRQLCVSLPQDPAVQFVLRIGVGQAPRAIEAQFAALESQPNFLKYQSKGPLDAAPNSRIADYLTGGAPLLGDPSHIQGVCRADARAGRPPYFFLTASGNPSNGLVFSVRMGTRVDSAGERLRSNLLLKGNGGGPWETTAPAADHVADVHVSEWQHLGGAQVVGDIMAVAAETPVDPGAGLPEGAILFFDVSDPEDIRQLRYRIEFDHKMGAVGMTRLITGEWLLVCGGYQPPDALYSGSKYGGWKLHFFGSRIRSMMSALKNSDPGDGVFRDVGGWELRGEPWYTNPAALGELSKDWLPGFEARGSELDLGPAGTQTPVTGGAVAGVGWPVQGEYQDLDSTFQNLSLVTQATGEVFLIGTKNAHNFSPTIVGDDLAVLYRLRSFVIPEDPDSEAYGTEQDIVTLADSIRGGLVERRWGLTARVWLRQCGNTRDNSEAKRQHANFNAGACPYLTPTGELLLYGTPHQLGINPGTGDAVGRLAEFEHMNLRDRYLGDELPWVKLYNKDSGWVRSIAYSCKDERRLLVEQQDHHLDDFDDFSELDSGNEPNQDDQVEGLRWYAPVGWKIVLWRDHLDGVTGGPKFELEGTGQVVELPVLDDADQFDSGGGNVRGEVSAVTFERIP